MGGLDPMEGPSWLFSDNEINNGPKQTKSRDEKRKENSLKPKHSSSSKRLSLEPESETERLNETEEAQPEATRNEPEVSGPSVPETDDDTVSEVDEEPRRRGGSRAAAKAARGALKEPTLGSKLRQGDPSSNSVYDNFVPGTKRKSDQKSSRKSSKGSGVKRKKSSDGK